MILQGTDGLSRGDMLEGVMRGESMLTHVPLHLSALERWPMISPWIESWARDSGNPVEILDPDGWFERGHDVRGHTTNVDGIWMPNYKAGTFIWAPAPSAAKTAIKQLRQARMKRQSSYHVFVCPRLMWTEWRRDIFKSADFVFSLPAGSDVWPADMHEPLIFAVFLPYLHRQPWELRKTKLVVELERTLQGLLKENCGAARDLLSKFLLSSQQLDRMRIRKLRGVLFGRYGFDF